MKLKNTHGNETQERLASAARGGVETRKRRSAAPTRAVRVPDFQAALRNPPGAYLGSIAGIHRTNGVD